MLAISLSEEDYDVASYNEQEESIADMLTEMMEARWSYNHIDTSSYDDVKSCYDELQRTRGYSDNDDNDEESDINEDTRFDPVEDYLDR